MVITLYYVLWTTADFFIWHRRLKQSAGCSRLRRLTPRVPQKRRSDSRNKQVFIWSGTWHDVLNEEHQGQSFFLNRWSGAKYYILEEKLGSNFGLPSALTVKRYASADSRSTFGRRSTDVQTTFDRPSPDCWCGPTVRVGRRVGRQTC